VLARAQELGYAEADPTEDVEGTDAAAKMAILARLAFHTPVSLDDVTYEGITAIQPDDIAYAKELGLSLKLLGVAERIGAGVSVRVFPCFLYPGHPLAPIEGPFNAVMVEAPTITEVTMSGPGAGGPETATAVLGDLVSILAGKAPVHEPRTELEVVRDVSSAFYLHLEVADRPGVLARIADVLGRNEVSVQSVVQRGLGDDARLVMVMHAGAEARFYAALEEIAKLDFLRAAPRAIRVIEEEFV
jgi:homoserine dehydrogenase